MLWHKLICVVAHCFAFCHAYNGEYQNEPKRECTERQVDDMTPQEIKENAKKYVLQSWSKQAALNPIPVEKAEGIYFYDYDGNRYTDMSSQLVNLNVGFGNKDIGDAIKEQVDKYCFVGPAYAAESRVKLAKMIVDLLPDTFGKVFSQMPEPMPTRTPSRLRGCIPEEKRCSAATEVIMDLRLAQET